MGRERREEQHFKVICVVVLHGFINQYFFQKPLNAGDTRKLTEKNSDFRILQNVIKCLA